MDIDRMIHWLLVVAVVAIIGCIVLSTFGCTAAMPRYHQTYTVECVTTNGAVHRQVREEWYDVRPAKWGEKLMDDVLLDMKPDTTLFKGM